MTKLSASEEKELMAGIEQVLRDEEPEWLHLRNADGTISRVFPGTVARYNAEVMPLDEEHELLYGDWMRD